MEMKEFVVEKVFEKIETKKIKGNAADFPTKPDKEHTIPLLTAGTSNQGLTRYAKESDCETILSNVLSVAANGNSGTTFYQPEKFAVLQDAYAIKVRNYVIPNEEIGLYLATCLHKAIAYNHDWNYKATWNRIKEEKFWLPIKIGENNNPVIDDTHFYHEEGYTPDFEYMRNYIIELEHKHTKDLERYLLATGLNDYELTEEDKNVLSL